MTLVEATKSCMHNYITFSGRASRSEFWKFLLFNILILIILAFVNSAIFGAETFYEVTLDQNGEPIGLVAVGYRYSSGVLGDIFSLLVLLPSLAVTWRRLHDTSLRGWWALAPMAIMLASTAFVIINTLGFSEAIQILRTQGSVTVPNPNGMAIFLLLVFGSFLLLILRLATKSTSGPNIYGPNPHEVSP